MPPVHHDGGATVTALGEHGRAGDPPAVSVCIPSYRGGALLAETIASVLAQSHGDFELLVIDDRSDDDSVEQALRHAGDPRLRVLVNPANLGPQGNWNRCLQEARGRYVKLLPQDDPIAPTLLERQVAVLDADAGHRVALVFCARDIIDGRGRRLLSKAPCLAPGEIDGPALVRRCVRAGTNLIGEPGAVMFRRALAQRVGAFDASIGYVVDLDYWSRLLMHGRGHYLPEALATFRVSGGSWSVRIGRGQAEAFSAFIGRLSRDPSLGVGMFDLLCGKLMARVKNVARLLVYRLVIERKRRNER